VTDAERLIRNVQAIGYDVSLKDSGPVLVKQREGATIPDEMVAELRLNRDAIAEHLRESQARESECVDSICGECRRLVCVYGGDTDAAFDACRASGAGNVMCGFWRPGIGPEWYAEVRRREEWQRRMRAEKSERMGDAIPE